MATKTINYNFAKPDNDDFYSIEVENENWDHADQQLKKLEEEKADTDGGDISETKIKTFDQPIEEFPVPTAGDSVKGIAGKVKKFFEDFKAFKNGAITVGGLVNNGLTTKEGFALDARYGKTLANGIAQLNGDWLFRNFKISGTYEFNIAPGVYLIAYYPNISSYNVALAVIAVYSATRISNVLELSTNNWCQISAGTGIVTIKTTSVGYLVVRKL